MKKLLIVSPHFPPVNAPDMQRTRLALPYLRKLGWEATVLALAPASVEGAVIEELLLQTFPADTRVIRVRGISPKATRWAGIGSLWWRCGRSMRRAGDQLLTQERFDLVFFSTTQFDAFTLGPRWLRQFGVPFVLDYQDPWVNDYYRETDTRPPGGSIKYWISQYTARRHEAPTINAAAAIVAVSRAYAPGLQKRYPWFDAGKMVTIPFGCEPNDLVIARAHQIHKPLVPFGDGHINHVYAGRCGPDMSIALKVLFRALRRFKETHPGEAARHRFHFIGTDYAPPPMGKFWALPVAEQEQVTELVHEYCYRVPYFDALHYLTHADALVVIGSNDATYSASKIYPYLMARRPMITISHEASQMLALARDQGIATTYAFSGKGDLEFLVDQVHADWFVGEGWRTPAPPVQEKLAHLEASSTTSALARVFEDALRLNGDPAPDPRPTA